MIEKNQGNYKSADHKKRENVKTVYFSVMMLATMVFTCPEPRCTGRLSSELDHLTSLSQITCVSYTARRKCTRISRTLTSLTITKVRYQTAISTMVKLKISIYSFNEHRW